jgi:ribosomal-protein-alanine N-acetyltransferase
MRLMFIEDLFGDLPRLETERTILRKISLEDAEDIFRYCSDQEVSKYTSWHPHQSIEDSKAFIAHILSLYDHGDVAPWGIEHKETRTLIGTCGFVYWNVKHSRAEIGFA